MRQTITELESLIKLQKPDYDSKLSDIPSKDKIKFRRDRINRLRIRGYSNCDVARQIGCSLSTVEKDLSEIRKRSKSWYEKESITDFCQSLYDSIVLCDNAIEDLQILFLESNDLQSKIEILNSISHFEERKTELFQKTNAVKKYCEVIEK